MRGLSVTAAAKRLGVTRGELYKLESGKRRLTDEWMRKLARVYTVAARDVVSDSGLTVTIDYVCCSFVNASAAIAPPQRYIDPPGFVMQPQDTFGAYIADDSANRLYPTGTYVVARHFDKLGRSLKRGDRVVARHFRAARREGDELEQIVGIVDLTVTGDLVILLPTDNRKIAGLIVVRPAVSQGVPAVGVDAHWINYQPADDDLAEVLGVIVAAVIPQ